MGFFGFVVCSSSASFGLDTYSSRRTMLNSSRRCTMLELVHGRVRVLQLLEQRERPRECDPCCAAVFCPCAVLNSNVKMLERARTTSRAN